MTSYTSIDTPLGPMLAFAQDGAVTGLYFPQHRRGRHPSAHDAADAAPFEQLEHELTQYWAGQRRTFDVTIALEGTDFERRVWGELQRIGYGQIATYAELARQCGYEPAYARAVGGAVGRNPVSILVPCHRVLGARQTLTGYAGGVQAKRALLALEGVAVG